MWNDGSNKYLVGTLKGRSVSGAEKLYRYARSLYGRILILTDLFLTLSLFPFSLLLSSRCFLYEEKTHHQGRVVYMLAQSDEPTCNGLTAVSEGSRTIKLTKGRVGIGERFLFFSFTSVEQFDISGIRS